MINSYLWLQNNKKIIIINKCIDKENVDMKNTKKQNVVLLIVYIVLSVVLFASLFFVAGAVFEWDFVLQLEKLIVKSNYDFDILVWGYWIAGISAVVLVAILDRKSVV